MLEAKSMYLGGEIVSSSECGYETSRNLGLICPFCSSAVFVRSESTRENRGRIQLVRPYFAHYPSNGNIDWDCERRSRTKQGREEIEQIKIQARNQRLRLYNARLWQMIAADRNISQRKLNQMRSLFGETWCERTSILVRHEWGQSLDSAYTMIDAALQEIHAEDLTDLLPSRQQTKLLREEQKSQREYLLGCDRRMHRAVSFEVADFLATNTAGFAFAKIFKACLFIETLTMGEGEIRRLQPRMHLPAIAGFLAGTRWMEQIGKWQDHNSTGGLGFGSLDTK